MRRVVLVTGPPCAGKTTHVAQHAQPGDLVLDQDQLGRTTMAASLAHVRTMTDGTAWVIRCAPGPRARRALAHQIGATEHVHLVEPEHTLVLRAAHRTNPRRHIAAVAAWFKRERADTPPRTRKTGPVKTTTEKGYGWTHQQARRDAIRDMDDGAPCGRCGQPMWRSQAKLLDLDHTDDRAGYRGLAHRACNRRAGQAKATTQRHQRTTQQRSTARSRNW